MFENLPSEKIIPERLTRAAQASSRNAADIEANDASESRGEDNSSNEPEMVDPFEFADPVNVLDKISSKFYEDLTSSKWKERKEALETLLALLKVPKIEDGRYGELVNALGKRINDANIVVLTIAVNCIEQLARGLRSNFSQYRSIVLSPLLEKLKEKKSSVIEAIRAALDAIFVTVSLSDVIEDIIAAASHKNPQVKSESIQWLVRSFKVLKKSPSKAEIKSFGEMLVKSLDDGDSAVRDAAAEAMGILMKLVTERLMMPYMDKLDKVKEAKVREFFDQAEVSFKGMKSTNSKKMVNSQASGKENMAPKSVVSSASSISTNQKIGNSSIIPKPTSNVSYPEMCHN